MSNPLRDNIVSLINQQLSAANDTYIGMVMTYYREWGTADIAYHSYEDGRQVAENVPVPNSVVSVFGEDPRPGDRVVLKFVEGLTNPAIISISRNGEKDLSTGKTHIKPSTLDSI